MTTQTTMYRSGKIMMSVDDIDARLRAMTYRELETFSKQHGFRMSTLEHWRHMGWQTQARLLRALHNVA